MNISLLMELFYPGEPIFKERTRASAFKGKDGKVRARVYTPESTIEGQESLKSFIRRVLPAGFFIKNTPLYLKFVVMRTPPASARKKDFYPLGKPDKDNYEKAIADSLNGIVIDDDSRIVGGEGWKQYAPRPGIYLALYRVEGVRFDTEDIKDMIGCQPLFDLSHTF